MQYLLLSGDASMQRETLGEIVTLVRAVAGDWLMEPTPCPTSGAAFIYVERKSAILSVPVDAIGDAIEREPGFGRAWHAVVVEQISRLQRRTERLSLRLAHQRVAHYLATESVDGSGDVFVPFPKLVWAAHLGIAPETLSRTLAEMVAAGALEMLRGNRYRLLRVD